MCSFIVAPAMVAQVGAVGTLGAAGDLVGRGEATVGRLAAGWHAHEDATVDVVCGMLARAQDERAW